MWVSLTLFISIGVLMTITGFEFVSEVNRYVALNSPKP